MTWIFRQLFAIAVLPFTAAVIIPVWLARRNAIGLAPGSRVGLLLFSTSLSRFITEGRGTLAPWDPPRHLVIAGAQRYVRNPMISRVLLVLIGEALLLVSWPHVTWALIFFAINAIYIPLVEEPRLAERPAGHCGNPILKEKSMKPVLWVFVGLSAFTVAACQPRVSREAETMALLERDRAWARAAATGNVDSIVSFWTEDARVLLPDHPAYVGTEAIRKMVTTSLAIPGFQISWTPENAIVSASGDLAYTYGTNSVTVPDSAGHPVTTEGRYVEVWRKEKSGEWRCSIDINNTGPAVKRAS